MNKYTAFWCSYRLDDIEADTSFEAQLKARNVFQQKTRRKVKPHDITVLLTEKSDGSPYVHTPVD